MALARSQAYQDAANASTTLRAYAADLADYKARCERHGFDPMPATPEILGAYLDCGASTLMGIVTVALD